MPFGCGIDSCLSSRWLSIIEFPLIVSPCVCSAKEYRRRRSNRRRHRRRSSRCRGRISSSFDLYSHELSSFWSSRYIQMSNDIKCHPSSYPHPKKGASMANTVRF